MANDNNFGNTTRISIEEVSRKVNANKHENIRMNTEIKNDLREIRNKLDEQPTRGWVRTSVILTAVGLIVGFSYHYNSKKQVVTTQPQKTGIIYLNSQNPENRPFSAIFQPLKKLLT